MDKTVLQLKIDEMSQQYALAHTVIRLPGYIPFLFHGPQIVDAPMHFRKARRNRNETLVGLGLQCLEDKKILLHCFGGHTLDAPSEIPKLPEVWACISQTIHCPPFFYKISHDVYMPDIIGACDVVLGKLGWGTCSEVVGNGYKPFIYVPRSAFIEEAGLLSWMESAHRRIVRLEVADYERNNWLGAIEESQRIKMQNPEPNVDWAKNDADLVHIFEAVLKNIFY
jgi:L-arabinokinase